MLAFYRLKYSKVPIWENKRRIAVLRRFIDTFNTYHGMNRHAHSWGNQLSTDQLELLSTQRTSLTQAIPEVHSITRLANVAMIAGHRYSGPVNILENAPNLDDLSIEPGLLIDQINQAIGTYLVDQSRSWVRTFSPIFWIARSIEWIAQFPAWFLSVIFGIEQGKVARSIPGRIATGLFGIICTLIGALAGLFYVLEWFGLKNAVFHRLGFK
jgi:hypothetical protein